MVVALFRQRRNFVKQLLAGRADGNQAATLVIRRGDATLGLTGGEVTKFEFVRDTPVGTSLGSDYIPVMVELEFGN